MKVAPPLYHVRPIGTIGERERLFAMAEENVDSDAKEQRSTLKEIEGRKAGIGAPAGQRQRTASEGGRKGTGK